MLRIPVPCLTLLLLLCAPALGERVSSGAAGGVPSSGVGSGEAVVGESISPGLSSALQSESIYTPPPPPLCRLPSVIGYDPPVPYYSQLCPSDDLPRCVPALELPTVKLGWIALAEFQLVSPYVNNTVTSGDPANGGIPVGNVPGEVAVPNAQLPWTGVPRIDVGYRLAQGLGEFHAILRSLNSWGTATQSNFDAAGAGTVRSQLNFNVLDLDYAFTEFNPGRLPRIPSLLLVPGRWGLNTHPEEDPYPTFRLKWSFGARLANVFFQSQASGAQILQERMVNNFVGAGLHTAVDLTKPLPRWPTWSVYGRLEASGLFGATTQSFSRNELLPGGGTATGAVSTHDFNLGVPILDVSCGLGYTSRWGNRQLQFTSGYVYEQWWYLGNTGLGNSNLGLTIQGLFFRCSLGY